MKRFLTIALFALVLGIGLGQQVQAADGDIELYPYDKEECLNAEPTCTRTKVGDAHWDLSYNGYNYNVAGGQARYVADMEDANSDGFIDATEMATNNWASFGTLFVNDTAEDVILSTLNARGDITSVVDRIYVYFDENGDLAMYEAHHVTTSYIFNDGTVEDPDWRLATPAEITIYDDADPKPENTQDTWIRIALDDADTDGYSVEPLAWLKWYAAGIDPLVDPVEDWSSIIADDPNFVYIPAGWTVLGIGTLDRDGSNPKTVDWLNLMAEALVAGTADPMELVYDDQPGWFSGLVDLDDDAGTTGVNIVVDYNGNFNLSNTIAATWLNMFDDTTTLIVNENEALDFSVTISEAGVDLETIDFVWNETNFEYDASAAVTVVDTSIFGAGYVATYMLTTPEGEVTTATADIVIGVMPPTFDGVVDQYINEGTYIDLRDGITADDGYGGDKTSSIMVTMPEDFNTYSPLPGIYTIDLEFIHHVHFDGEASTITIDGATEEFAVSQIDSVTALNVDAVSEFAIFTDSTMAQDVGWAWGSLMVLVGADGLVDGVYDRYTWDIDDSTGAWVGDADVFAAWKDALVIEEGGFVIASHGSTKSPALRALTYDSPVTYVNREIDTVTIDGVRFDWDKAQLDSVTALNVSAVSEYAIFTDETMAQDVGWAWGSLLVLVGADGLVDAVYDRYTWDIDDSTGAWVGDGVVFEAWKAALVIEDGGFVIGSHGSTKSPELRALAYDDDLSYMLSAMEFDYDIHTYDSFIVTVDDITAPQAMVIDEDYTVVVGEFATADEAILANVAAFDFYDAQEDLAIYVSDNGGTIITAPGTYSVAVTIEDVAGNSAVVEFDLTVVAAPVIVTQAEIDAAIDAAVDVEVQGLLDAQTLTDAEIQALLDAQTITDAEIQALIDAAIDALPEDEVGATTNTAIIAAVVAGVIALGGSVILLKFNPFI